jgi:hypothetical protein
MNNKLGSLHKKINLFHGNSFYWNNNVNYEKNGQIRKKKNKINLN